MIDTFCFNILDKISFLLDNIVKDQFIEDILKAERIFVVGAGRSGLVGRFFAMRLMHIGKNIFVVGETTTPSIDQEDLLIAISQSGKTSIVVNAAKTAKDHGARVIIISSNPESTLANISDTIIRIDNFANSQLQQKYIDKKTTADIGINLTPMGTLFELSTLIFLESIIARIIVQCNISESNMKKRHTNLE